MSKNYGLCVRLLSRAVIASAEGYGALIDTDIVFDEVGLPYIPARRIKGCLRDSAIEVLDMLFEAKIEGFLDLTIERSDKFRYKLVNEVFGVPGMDTPSKVSLTNLHIREYPLIKQWLEYLTEARDSKDLISRDSITAFYTDTTKSTAIDKDTGTAKETSLRTTRSVKAGLEFCGEIKMATCTAAHERLLCLAAANLRSMGSMRTRGFGRVRCEIEGLDSNLILKQLEGICIN